MTTASKGFGERAARTSAQVSRRLRHLHRRRAPLRLARCRDMVIAAGALPQRSLLCARLATARCCWLVCVFTKRSINLCSACARSYCKARVESTKPAGHRPWPTCCIFIQKYTKLLTWATLLHKENRGWDQLYSLHNVQQLYFGRACAVAVHVT